METIIIEIMLGNNGEVVEFMLPAHVPLGALLQDIVAMIEQVNQTVAFDKNSIVLVDIEHNNLLRPDWTLAQNQVHDGSRLMIL